MRKPFLTQYLCLTISLAGILHNATQAGNLLCSDQKSPVTTKNNPTDNEIIAQYVSQKINQNYQNILYFKFFTRSDEKALMQSIKNEEFDEICDKYLPDIFIMSAKDGNLDILKKIMKHAASYKINNDNLGSALKIAAQNDKIAIVSEIINDSKFDKIYPACVRSIFMHATNKGLDTLLKTLLTSKAIKKISSNEFEKALENTEFEKKLAINCFKTNRPEHNKLYIVEWLKYQNIQNWLKAYTALTPQAHEWLQKYKEHKAKLKPEQTAKPKELLTLHQQAIVAYDNFLNGETSNLRNLFLPVLFSTKINPKERTTANCFYPLTLEKESATLAMRIMNSVLINVFKEDHIKPLLLSLVETQSQKDFAIELLKYMHLSENKINKPQPPSPTAASQ